MEEPLLLVRDIPPCYLKPKFKVPASLLTPKPKKKPHFNLRTHGIKKQQHRYWFKCEMKHCTLSFLSIKLWNLHHKIKHKSACLTCTVCKRIFTRPSAKWVHQNAHTLQRHQCNTCKKCFSYVSQLKQHKNVHTTTSYKCFTGECGHSYKWSKDLNRHVKTHLEKKIYSCPTCSKSFREGHLLKRHLIKHQDIFHYVCSKCGYRTKWLVPYN